MEFSEICRLCLCTERMFVPLHNTSANLEEKIYTISSKVQVSIGDGLPAQVCQQCVNLLNTCYDFKLQCEKSDDTLHQYLRNYHHKHSEQTNDLHSTVSDLTSVENQTPHSEFTNRQIKDEMCKTGNWNDISSSANDDDMSQTNVVEFAVPNGALDEGEYRDSLSQKIKLVPVCKPERIERVLESVRSDPESHSADCWVKGDRSMLRKKGQLHPYKNVKFKVKSMKVRELCKVKYHECTLCGKSVQKLSLHMKMHTDDRPYQCSVCGQRFIQKGSLHRHNTLHTGERPYCCSLCGKTFRCKSDLNQHSKLHTGEAFKCSVCKKEFTTRQNLDNHFRTHTGEKPYLCHTCGMHFTQRGALTKHSRIHTNDRPHQCSECDKRFLTQSALNLHFRTHTGEKPYTCATCHKSFTDRGYFMRHLSIHSGEKSFVCSMCGKGFTQQISLKRHTRLHTGEKPFPCKLCGEKFALKRDLKRHCERLHETNM